MYNIIKKKKSYLSQNPPYYKDYVELQWALHALNYFSYGGRLENMRGESGRK